jgi:hypothetical protein
MMHRNKTIKYGYLVLALALILETTSARALEMKDPQREDRRLRIELETVPTPPQQDFEQYVQDLAASAQREAKESNSKREEDAAKAKQPKSFNPLVLFRW